MIQDGDHDGDDGDDDHNDGDDDGDDDHNDGDDGGDDGDDDHNGVEHKARQRRTTTGYFSIMDTRVGKGGRLY